MRVRPLVQNAALAAGSLLLTLLLLEAAVRVVMSRDRNYFDGLLALPPETGAAELRLGDIIRPVDDDLLVYTLLPGAEGTFEGQPLRINSLGMRDRERSRAKPPGTFRILGLGDSHAFGWRVRQEETFYALLEGMLDESRPGLKVEVLNLGVPGYNTVQEVRAFDLQAEDLGADMVIINYVDNDMDLPNFLGRRPDLLTLRHSYLMELVARRLALARGSELFPLWLEGAPADPETRRYRLPEERIPERYRPLYGRENMKEAFRRLARLSRAMGIPCVLLVNMDDYRRRLAGRTTTVLPREVRELAALCEEEGFLVVDPQERVLRYLREGGLGTEGVWVAPDDSHSNAARHRLVAEELRERIEAAGLVPGRG